jgi:predicted CopG family antitoxin
LPLSIKNITLLQVLMDIFKEASHEDVRNELEEIKKEIELNY